MDVHQKFDTIWSGVVSLEYQYRSLLFAAEYVRDYGKDLVDVTSHAYMNLPNGPGTSRVDLGTSTTNAVGYDRQEGGYASLSYNVLPKLAVAVGRGVHYGDYKNRGVAWHRSWTVSARYDILSNWLIKAEWESNNGTDQLLHSENPNGYHENWQVFALKTTVDF